jgi:hypothetical protein
MDHREGLTVIEGERGGRRDVSNDLGGVGSTNHKMSILSATHERIGVGRPADRAHGRGEVSESLEGVQVAVKESQLPEGGERRQSVRSVRAPRQGEERELVGRELGDGEGGGMRLGESFSGGGERR